MMFDTTRHPSDVRVSTMSPEPYPSKGSPLSSPVECVLYVTIAVFSYW